ncbi:MAG: hydroxyacylglutathione hydrolase [Alphaproteobacteria bacterium]|jgi:hydroxyacylglutathione hydrolase|nr:hydroxyacylglutathione hydrolase [Alphaproteobacteria bacterium]
MQWTFTKILKDNYAWIIYNEKNEAIIIDCGEAAPIIKFLKEKHLDLKYILITHAHEDHIGELDQLKAATGAIVVGNKHFKERLPHLDMETEGGEVLNLLGENIKVLATPGHCADHIIFYFENDKLLFTGDFLFSLGCGRVFEGDNSDMVNSFNVLKGLPPQTLVFPSHEYTKSNLMFTKSLGFFDLGDRERFILENDMTLPTVLEFEFRCNPFLNLNNAEFKHHVLQGMPMDAVAFFAYLRELKSNKTKLIGG